MANDASFICQSASFVLKSSFFCRSLGYDACNVFITPLTEMTNEVFGVERCFKSLVSLNQVSV